MGGSLAHEIVAEMLTIRDKLMAAEDVVQAAPRVAHESRRLVIAALSVDRSLLLPEYTTFCRQQRRSRLQQGASRKDEL